MHHQAHSHRLFTGPNRLLRALLALQLAAIVVVGVATVIKTSFWSPGDEAAHFAYGQHLVEEGRLPLLNDRLSPGVIAVSQGVYPGPPRPIHPWEPKIGRLSYEAFQPPLYYLSAVPVLSLSKDLRTKAHLLRLFDLGLLLVGVALVLLLSRRIFAGEHLLPSNIAVSVLLWPGVVVREVTVSNTALELVMSVALLLLLWRADSEQRRGLLVAAGLAFALCLATKLTSIYLLPLLLVVAARMVWRRRDARTVAASAASLLLAPLLLAPWAAFNHDHYGSLTANSLAREQQAPLIQPDRRNFQVSDLHRASRVLEGFLPQEWDKGGVGGALPGLDSPLDLIPLLVLLPAGALLLDSGVRRRGRELLLLGAPFLLALTMMAATLVLSDWDIFFTRYLYPTLPGVALMAGWAVHRLHRSPLAVAYAALMFVIPAGAWIYLAGRYYFTDVGAALGIT
jgi:4-amino-4-deoxy-L-arabinose transferase-like glycosyltransferase